MAVASAISVVARADVRPVGVAASAVDARTLEALVDVVFAMLARETGSCAVALEGVDSIQTPAFVLARIGGTLIDVLLAIGSGKSGLASTLVIKSRIDGGAVGPV